MPALHGAVGDVLAHRPGSDHDDVVFAFAHPFTVSAAAGAGSDAGENSPAAALAREYTGCRRRTRGWWSGCRAGGLEPTGSWTRPLGHATRSCDDARPPSARSTPSRGPALRDAPRRETSRLPSAVRPVLAVLVAVAVSVGGAVAPASATLLERATAPAAVAAAPLTNLAHLDFLLDEATPPADVDGHTTYRLAEEPTLVLPWTYADARPGGTFERVGGGAPRRGDRHVGTGRLQRRRRRACGRRVPAALDADRLRAEPRQRLRAAPLARLPADDRRTERGQRRAVDAARRHAEPVRGAGRAARPVRLRTELLARPHDLGARRGLRGLPRRRPGVRRRSSRIDSRSRSARWTGRCW